MQTSIVNSAASNKLAASHKAVDSSKLLAHNTASKFKNVLDLSLDLALDLDLASASALDGCDLESQKLWQEQQVQRLQELLAIQANFSILPINNLQKPEILQFTSSADATSSTDATALADATKSVDATALAEVAINSEAWCESDFSNLSPKINELNALTASLNEITANLELSKNSRIAAKAELISRAELVDRAELVGHAGLTDRAKMASKAELIGAIKLAQNADLTKRFEVDPDSKTDNGGNLHATNEKHAIAYKEVSDYNADIINPNSIINKSNTNNTINPNNISKTKFSSNNLSKNLNHQTKTAEILAEKLAPQIAHLAKANLGQQIILKLNPEHLGSISVQVNMLQPPTSFGMIDNFGTTGNLGVVGKLGVAGSIGAAGNLGVAGSMGALGNLGAVGSIGVSANLSLKFVVEQAETVALLKQSLPQLTKKLSESQYELTDLEISQTQSFAEAELASNILPQQTLDLAIAQPQESMNNSQQTAPDSLAKWQGYSESQNQGSEQRQSGLAELHYNLKRRSNLSHNNKSLSESVASIKSRRSLAADLSRSWAESANIDVYV